jgi:organic hydroperoxide reductase OsmC/OhrA
VERILLDHAMMSAQFPHLYATRIARTSSSRALIDAPPREPIAGGPPTALDGDAMSWSPEHLLLASIGMYLLAAFDALAARERVQVFGWDARASATVDRTADGLAFTTFVLDVAIAASDPERARTALDAAARHCLVANALRVPVDVRATFSTALPAERPVT